MIDAPPRGGRDRHRPLFRRGGAPRADGPVWREDALRGRAPGAHQPRCRRCRPTPTRRCATGSSPTTAANGGWRGAVDHIEPGADWPAGLGGAAAAGRRRAVGWQLAVVTAHRKRRRGDRPQGRLDRTYPVRADALGAAAARRRHARRLPAQRRRCRQARRSRAGRAAARADAAPVKTASNGKLVAPPPAKGRCTTCARSPKFRARWSRSTRIPAGCWR